MLVGNIAEWYWACYC